MARQAMPGPRKEGKMSHSRAVSRVAAVLLLLALCLPAMAPAAVLQGSSEPAPNRVATWFQSAVDWAWNWLTNVLEDLDPVIAPEHGEIVP